jgi:hypothetical protein
MHFAHIRREFAANFAKNRIIRILLKFERSIVPNSPEIPSSAASTPIRVKYLTECGRRRETTFAGHAQRQPNVHHAQGIQRIRAAIAAASIAHAALAAPCLSVRLSRLCDHSDG